jgi:hypothetical protein
LPQGSGWCIHIGVKSRTVWFVGIGTGILFGAVLGGLFSIPSIVRWEIHKRHPEVSYSYLGVSWSHVTLHDVRIDKGWMTLAANTAYVNTATEAVHLSHCKFDANVDERPDNSRMVAKSEQSNVTADDCSGVLSWKNVGHTDGGRSLNVLLHKVDVDKDTVHIGDSDILYGPYRAHLVNIEAPRNFGHAKVEKIDFPEGVSFRDGKPFFPTISSVNVDIPNRTALIDSVAFDFNFGENQATSINGLGTTLSLNGDKLHVFADKLKIGHPWISPVGTNVGFQKVTFDMGPWAWREPLELKIDQATLHIDPMWRAISGDESCSTWAEALPDDLAEGPLRGKTQWGPSHIKFSLGMWPKPHFNIEGKCSATCNDESVTALRHRFSYFTYDDKGQRNSIPRSTGPDDPEWVPLSEISENMFNAVANMEDWGFWSHHGYVPAALEQSFLADVRSGKFQRGGSTITMQVAKNIFLSRAKTVGRKVSELLLSQVLESCFNKKEILELYLNVVEFGPNIYGLHQAAAHYFKVKPMSLDPREAFYLAWILPRPKRSPPPNAATMAHMDTLMRMLAKEGRIPDSEMMGIDEADATGWEAP